MCSRRFGWRTAARRFFSFFIRFASDLVVEALAPVKNPRDPEEIVGNRHVTDDAAPGSADVLYSPANSTILDC